MNDRSLQIVLFLSCLVASCAESTISPDVVEDHGGLMPVDVGNYFLRIEQSFNENGQLITQDTVIVSQIMSDTIINRYRWFIRQETPFDVHPVRNLSDGFYIWAGGPVLLYKYPTYDGDIYDPYGSKSVVTTDSLIMTPEGSFHCILYRATQILDTSLINYGERLDEFIAPGIGPIRTDHYWPNSTTGQPYLFERYVYIERRIVNKTP